MFGWGDAGHKNVRVGWRKNGSIGDISWITALHICSLWAVLFTNRRLICYGIQVNALLNIVRSCIGTEVFVFINGIQTVSYFIPRQLISCSILINESKRMSHISTGPLKVFGRKWKWSYLNKLNYWTYHMDVSHELMKWRCLTRVCWTRPPLIELVHQTKTWQKRKKADRCRLVCTWCMYSAFSSLAIRELKDLRYVHMDNLTHMFDRVDPDSICLELM